MWPLPLPNMPPYTLSPQVMSKIIQELLSLQVWQITLTFVHIVVDTAYCLALSTICSTITPNYAYGLSLMYANWTHEKISIDFQ